MEVVNLYGSDALRLYLINSPVVRAETLRFQEKGVRDVLKEVFLPWFNAYRFFVEVVRKYNKDDGKHQFVPNAQIALQSSNVMDQWILSETSSLITFVRQEMQAYRLYTVVPRLVKYIEQLTNWYVRLNRKRLKGSSFSATVKNSVEDCNTALCTLFEVLYMITREMAPFTPFLSEYFYQNLRKVLVETDRLASVHYTRFPEPQKDAINRRIEEAVSRMQSVIQLGRAARDRRTLPLKFPLTRVTCVHRDPQFQEDLASLRNYILEELNVREMIISSDDSSVVTVARAENQLLGKRLRKDLGKVSKAIENLSDEQIRSFQNSGSIVLEGYTLSTTDLQVIREFKGDLSKFEAAWDQEVLIVLSLEVDHSMREEGMAREIINRIQRLRKKAGIHPSDPIEVFYRVKQNDLPAHVISTQRELIRKGIGVCFSPLEYRPSSSVVIMEGQYEISEAEVKEEKANHLSSKPLANKESSSHQIMLSIARLQFDFDDRMPLLDNNGSPLDPAVFTDLKTLILSRDYLRLLEQISTCGGLLNLNLNGKDFQFSLGKQFFSSVEDRLIRIQHQLN